MSMLRAARTGRREPEELIGTTGMLGSGGWALPTRCPNALPPLCYRAKFFLCKRIHTTNSQESSSQVRICRNPSGTDLRLLPSSHRAFDRQWGSVISPPRCMIKPYNGALQCCNRMHCMWLQQSPIELNGCHLSNSAAQVKNAGAGACEQQHPTLVLKFGWVVGGVKPQKLVLTSPDHPSERAIVPFIYSTRLELHDSG